MIDPSVLVDKLNSMESTCEIADFLYHQDIAGNREDSLTCVISQWISRESGRTVTTARQIKVWNNWDEINCYCAQRFEVTEAVWQFIRQFDDGQHPHLVNSLTPSSDNIH
jgi:hypothetical protein